MAIRQPPSSIKDPNLRGFLQELRNAIGKTGDQVAKLMQVRSVSGGGGGGGGGEGPGPGPGPNPPEPPQPPQPPKTTTVVLTIDPTKPLSEEDFTLTATVTGDNPTGAIQFRQDGSLMTLDPVALSSSVASLTAQLAKGIYTFVAEYSGDVRNLPAVSNALTVEIGSMWDGPPASVTTLTALSGIGYIVLKWTMPYIGDLDTIEVWGSLSNDRATATKLGESNGSLFVYVPPANQPTWYFWVRVRDAEGLFSDYYPNTTAGVMGTALSLEDEIADTPLWIDLGARLDGIDLNIQTQVAQLQGQIDEVLGAPDYDPLETYYLDDIVKYDGSIYRALQTTTGNLPTNTTYWEHIGNYTSIGDAVAAHTNQISMLVTDLSAEVSARETLAARVASAEGDIITQAGYINNRYTKAEVDSAMAAQLTGIVASYESADADTLDAAKTYSDAAVTTESLARASADEALSSLITTVSATAGAKNKTYRQASAPTSGMTAGDIWFDSDDGNKAYRYNGTSWEPTDDTRIAANAAAIQVEATARADADSALASQITTVAAVANSKNKTYRQTTAPTSGMIAGDLWFDSDDNNKAYRYNGTAWVPTDDTRIGQNAAAIQTEITARADADSAMASQITTLQTSVAGNTATIQTQATVIDGIKAQYMVKTDVNGLVSGFGLYNNGEVSDFFVRADRFAVGNPALLRTGTCSIAGHTTAAACKAAGGTWTWTDASTQNIPFIVYTTQQTINAPDGSGKTLTIEPGVYIKTANVQKAFIGDAEIYGDLKSYSWAAAGGPNTFPFNGWKLDKASNLALYGGSFALYDEYGNPVIQAGKIEFNQFKRLIVSASSELFTIPKPPNTAITPSTITLNAVLQNISGTVTWTTTNGTYGGTLGTGVQKTIDPAQMTTATVTFKAATTVGGIVYEDSVTLAKVQDGSDTLWLYLDNEAHLVPASSDGTVTSYAGAQTGAKVYRGATDVTTSEGWTISAASYTGLSGPPDVVGQTVGFVDGSPSMIADVATITVRASKSGQTNLDRVFTVSKAKQGIQGPAGGSGIVIDLSNDSHLVPTDNTGGNGNYTGCASTASIYEGASDTSTTWTWVAPAVTGGITGTASNSNRTYTVTGMTADTGTVTFSATKSGLPTQTVVFTVTKVKAGTPGTNATVYSVTPSVGAINKSIAGVFNPTTVTFSATSTTGTSAPAAYAGRFKIYENGSATASYTSSANESSKVYTPTSGAKSIKCELYLAGGTTTLVDYEAIPVVSDGATGAQGATGPTGAAGPQGATGPAGATLYTWIAYSNSPDGANPNTGAWNGEAYIGLANNKTSATESTNPADYVWSKIQGDQGVPGTPGADGQPTYTWFAYANDATGSSGFTTGAWTNQTYIGIAANKLTMTESTNPADYTWSKIQGAQGPSGPAGLNTATVYLYRRSVSTPALPSATVTYTFSTKAVTGLTNSWTQTIPAGTDPIWVTAATASSTTDTDTIATNEWASATVLAQNGVNGVDGTDGIDGLNTATIYIYRRSASVPALPSATTTYTFATKSLTGLNNSWSTTVQAGTDPIYVSTATAVANTASDTILATEWATPQILAQNGGPGPTGPQGLRGSRQFNLSGFSSWTNAAAAAANTLITVTNAATTGGYLVISDTVALTDATTDIVRFYNGGTATSVTGWSSVSVKIDGNLLVAGTVGTNALAANQVWAKQITLEDGKQVGTTYPANYIRSSNFTFGGSQGFMIGGDGNAEFNNVKVRGDVLLGGGNMIQNSVGASTTDLYLWGTGGLGSASTGSGSPTNYFIYSTSGGSGLISGSLNFARPGTGLGITAGGGKFLVNSNGRYQLSAWVGSSNCSVNLVAFWYTSADVYISGNTSTTSSNKLGAAGSTTINDTNWARLAMTLTAPSNAAYAVIGVQLLSRVNSSATSTIYASQVSFVQVTSSLPAANPPNAVDIIPWSPGGISLLDTLALRANAATKGAASSSLGFVGWSSGALNISYAASGVGDVVVQIDITLESSNGGAVGVWFELFIDGARADYKRAQSVATTGTTMYSSCSLCGISTSKSTSPTISLVKTVNSAPANWSYAYVISELKR